MDVTAADGSARDSLIIDREQLSHLLVLLKGSGYQVVGPTIDQEAIVYGELDSLDDLPIGWTDVQDGGEYRIARRDDQALFGYNVGPHSWKKFLFPSSLRLL